MTTPKYKLLFFDADETLFDHSACEHRAFHETLFTHFALPQTDAEIIFSNYKEINQALWLRYHKGELSKDAVLIGRFIKLFEIYHLQTDEVEFGDAYLTNLANQKVLIPYAFETLEILAQHCKLVVITNGSPVVQLTRFGSSEINQFISDLVISNHELQKPDAKIFQYSHTKNAAHIPHKEILMVGDSLGSDILGGINYGIDTCWFNPNKSNNQMGITPTHEITTLTELVNIVLK